MGSGAVAQLGERLLCKQEVIGSIPFSSTSFAGVTERWFDDGLRPMASSIILEGLVAQLVRARA